MRLIFWLILLKVSSRYGILDMQQFNYDSGTVSANQAPFAAGSAEVLLNYYVAKAISA